MTIALGPRTLFILVWTMLAPTLALADAERELRQLEEQRRAAIQAKDFPALGGIYAPSFVGVTGTGALIDREELFRVFRQADGSLTFKTDDIRIVQHGDTAVFFGRLDAFDAAGKTLFSSRFSHVFVRQDGRWICVAGQSTPLRATGGGGQ